MNSDDYKAPRSVFGINADGLITVNSFENIRDEYFPELAKLLVKNLKVARHVQQYVTDSELDRLIRQTDTEVMGSIYHQIDDPTCRVATYVGRFTDDSEWEAAQMIPARPSWYGRQ